jgi:hypothetical protein
MHLNRFNILIIFKKMNNETVRSRINILYENLFEILQNIISITSSQTSQANPFARPSIYRLSHDQRLMVDTYMTMYNNTLRHLDYLYEELPRYVVTETNDPNRIYINGAAYVIETAGTPPHSRSPGTRTTRTNRESSETSLFENRTFNVLIAEALRQLSSPVVVRPSVAQIERATREVTFSSIQNPPNSNCPICLDVFEEESTVRQIIHCGHSFVPGEINRWFETNVRCPVCRYDIRDFTPAEETPRDAVADPTPTPIQQTTNRRVNSPASRRRSRNSIESINDNNMAYNNILTSLSNLSLNATNPEISNIFTYSDTSNNPIFNSMTFDFTLMR